MIHFLTEWGKESSTQKYVSPSGIWVLCIKDATQRCNIIPDINAVIPDVSDITCVELCSNQLKGLSGGSWGPKNGWAVLAINEKSL